MAKLSGALGFLPDTGNVNTYGTGTVEDLEITRLIRKHFDLTPQGIIESLDLRRPIYGPTASYGHFGRNEAGFTWENCDKAEELRNHA